MSSPGTSSTGQTVIENVKPKPSERERENLRKLIRSARKNMKRDNATVKTFTCRDPYDIYNENVNRRQKQTGLYYSMNDHKCPWDEEHPECPERLNSIKKRLEALELDEKCLVRQITDVEIPDSIIHLKHSFCLIENLRVICMMNETTMEEECSQYDSIFINKDTFSNALIAVQTVYELAVDVALGRLQNGFAVVRPPGHHAQFNDYNGYCFFNNVAITAEKLIQDKMAKRVLIIDYDVHHGQGTQNMFYERNDVLYFSIHRYEHGLYWPNLKESNTSFIGADEGKGFNINVPLNETGCTDSDYIAIVLNILLPVAYEFAPDFILISGGYDAAIGCPEGEMKLTPSFYSHLITLLGGLAMGKIVVALEGGYNLDSLSESVVMTVKALLAEAAGNILPFENVKPSVWDTINNLKFFLKPYWNCFPLTETFQYPRPVNEKNLAPSLEVNVDEEYVPFEMYLGKPEEKPFPTRYNYPQLAPQRKEYFENILNETRSEHSQAPENFTGYVNEPNMALHESPYFTSNVPERPDRFLRVIEELEKRGILKRMIEVTANATVLEELFPYHDSEYLVKTLINKELPNTKDLFIKDESISSILASAGAVKGLLDRMSLRQITNGLAIVRPPGHHAHFAKAGGFCFINNVVLGAKYAINYLKYKRVLIVDFDIHHGDGTQELTYDRKDIMYISVHRYDKAAYFPKSTKADYSYTGTGIGEGYNVNIPFNNSRHGNTEYLLTFLNVVLPIAYSYCPDLVLVSAGFDAGVHDPLGGGYNIYPEMFGQMIQLLKPLARGNVLVCMEGGYNLTTLKYSMVMCAKALLGDPIPMPSLYFDEVSEDCVASLKTVINEQKKYWPVLKVHKKIGDRCIGVEDKAKIQSIMARLRIRPEEIDDKVMEEITRDFTSLTTV
ncbi:unnamed protein product [Brassicogethes aeneus]|uniref:Histone deacetylase domain-containing protein n=1 Tax=Brassicogethes aeneus TaxID=1431903 RepID=A0A9P0FPJ0_BRAAE|nr:unnamed protein product [Brassicogethes aeneus]